MGAAEDAAFAQWVKAISSGIDPEAIQRFAGAVASGVPPEVAANPSDYRYDYANDPTSQIPGAVSSLGERNLAFNESDAYDFRTDPEYLALQRAYNFRQAEAQRQAAQTIGNLDVLQPVTEADILANQEEALRQTDLNAEARGLYRSGERLENRGRVMGDYGRQLTQVQLTGALQRGNVQSDLAAAMAAIDRQRADTEALYATPPLPKAPSGAY